MRLKQWRLTQALTLAEMATRLSIENPRTYQRYEEGENRVDAPLAECVVAVTDGVVSIVDLHEQRLEWLKANRPDAFDHSKAVTSHQEAAV